MDFDSFMLGALIGMVVLGLLLAATHRTYRRTLQHCADTESAEKLPDGSFYYLVREDRYGALTRDASDAERFRWLTEDHAHPAQREACRNLLDRMARMSYSAACMSIDVHRDLAA
jgi:hypothetical protein